MWTRASPGRPIRTNAGVYLFSNVQAGTYRVTFTARSFKTVVADNLRINANEVRRVDMGLQIATPARPLK